MNRYGQTLTYSALSAPQIFTCEPTSYSLRDAATKQLIDGAAGDWIARVLHSRKGELSFEGKVTSGSTNFLDLSAGAALAVSTITTGVVLAYRAVERWRLGQPKTASVAAYWYPDMVQASPTLAGTGNNAFLPDQSALGIVVPGAEVVYGTYGFTHSAGIIHELTLTQSLIITDDEPSPAGTLLGAGSHGYEQTMSLMILANLPSSTNPVGNYPAVGSTLTIGGGTSKMANFKIVSSEFVMETDKEMMFNLEASWISAD